MDFKKIKEQIRWIRKQYSDLLAEQKAQKQSADTKNTSNASSTAEKKK